MFMGIHMHMGKQEFPEISDGVVHIHLSQPARVQAAHMGMDNPYAAHMCTGSP